MDTGCSLEDQPEAMNDRDRWRERERERESGKSVLVTRFHEDDMKGLKRNKKDHNIKNKVNKCKISSFPGDL